MREVRFKDLKIEERILVQMAEAARENAYTPYYKYKVGAAVMSGSKEIYSGCNVESCIGQTTHAEKNAIDTMAANGEREILALCCAAENGGIPCPECRQFIWEFCDNDPSIKIIGVDSKRNVHITTIGELIPYPFGPKDLGVNPKKY